MSGSSTMYRPRRVAETEITSERSPFLGGQQEYRSLSRYRPPPSTTASERPAFRVVGGGATAADAASSIEGDATSLSSTPVINRWRADAMIDPLGMFILQEIADRDAGIDGPELDEYLATFEAWLALARLLRAGLLDENGLGVYATPQGRDAAEFTRSIPDRLG